MGEPSADKVALTRAETMRHILTVRSILSGCAMELLARGEKHDLSKLSPPEDVMFAEVTERLSGLTYGSKEYMECVEEMKKGALQHHYDNNSHHPEHSDGGIEAMNLFDLLEMLCDWKAATLRHKDGDMEKSLYHNAERFNIPTPLARILWNTNEAIENMAAGQQLQLSYPHWVEDPDKKRWANIEKRTEGLRVLLDAVLAAIERGDRASLVAIRADLKLQGGDE